jgi:hypothetical protein
MEMMDYYEYQAKQELFEEQWVSREDYNDLLDRCKSYEEEVKMLEERLARVDKVINDLESIEYALSKEILKLYKGSKSLCRAADLIEDSIEKAVNGE